MTATLPTPPLSRRELQTVRLLARGLRSVEIGAELGLSPQTVQGYVKSIREKWGAHTQAHVIAMAYEAGILGEAS